MGRFQSGLRRRAVLTGLAGVAAAASLPACAKPASDFRGLWQIFRGRFVEDDGRVVDSYNNRISHSESQGWGMLIAAAAEDWPAFERIWGWTAQNLQWAGAPLFAWVWDPEGERVRDPNDASDGDILIAWALARAGQARKRNDWIDAARATAVAVRTLVTTPLAGGLALLPGFYGFSGGGVATVNLSYYVFPAFTDFARLDPDPAWAALTEDGVALARRARFGGLALAPDWLDVAPDGKLTPAANWPPRFGFDAVRVPLYLAWAGIDDDADLATYRAAWRSADPPPAWFSLDGGEHADHAASAGVLAIRDVIEGRKPSEEILWSAVKEGEYYSASLALLSLMAAEANDLR